MLQGCELLGQRIHRVHHHESSFTLLTNGEEKFPEVLSVLASAKHSIHMEYYAWENDVRGNEIKTILLKKAKEGVKVRVMYDDYASRKIKRNIVKQLKAGGVSVFPAIKVKVAMLANRVNHRDHRKIIIVDGVIGFVGGIDVSDRYDNSIDTGLYWRDTHVKIEGPLAGSLQRHFIVAWNSCQQEQLTYNGDLFPGRYNRVMETSGVKAIGQVVAGGPVYPTSNIMLTYFKIFTLAKEKLYITNPYFIPNDSILDALKQARHAENPETYERRVKEVREGTECGMAFESYDDLKEGDIIECYDVISEARSIA